MPIETLVLGLGAVLAKEIAKALIKDSGMLDAAGILIELFKSQGENSVADTKIAFKIGNLTQEITRSTLLLFGSETRELSEDDRKRVLAEVAATIASCPLTAERLASHDYDFPRIAAMCISEQANRVARAQLSQVELNLYERAVTEIVRAVSGAIVAEASFVPTMLSSALKKLDSFQSYALDAIVNRLEQQRDHDYEQRVARFEQEYLSLCRKRFDSFDFFGIREVEDQISNRRLSKTYVSLSAKRPGTLSGWTREEVAQVRSLLAHSFEADTSVTVFHRTVALQIDKVFGASLNTLTRAAHTIMYRPEGLQAFLESPGVARSAPLAAAIRSVIGLRLIFTKEEGRLAPEIAGIVSTVSRNKQQSDTPLEDGLSLEQAVASSPRLIVVGAAGSGKSTLIRYLAVKAAGRDLPSQLGVLSDCVPFVLRLRLHSDRPFPPIEEWQLSEFPALQPSPDRWARRKLESGRALVMIDGVDELPRAKREETLTALDQFVALYPAARYIITSRPEAFVEWQEWAKWVEDASFAQVSVDPMSPNQRSAFIERWFAEYSQTIKDIEARNNMKGMDARLGALLGRTPALRDLAANPLLCAMICSLYEYYRDSLPQRRIELYDKCVDLTLTLRDDRRSVRAAKDYRVIEDKRKLLQHVAEWMGSVAGGETTTTETHRVIARMDRWLADRNTSGVTGEEMMRFYVERAGLLREPSMGRTEFTHRTFQEYLTACELCDQDRLENLHKRGLDGPGKETFVIASGLGTRVQRVALLGSIASKGSRNSVVLSRWQLPLLLECLEAIGSGMTNTERERAVLELVGTDTELDLDLWDTSISEIDPLGGLVPLLRLMIRSDYVRDVSCIAKLTNLRELGLHLTCVREIDAISNLTNLQELDLSGTSLMSVAPLGRLTNLQSLNLSNTGVTDLNALSNLTNLRALNASNTGVSDISVVSHLHALQTLDLGNTMVRDLSPLASLKKLTAVNLGGTPVLSIAALAGLTALSVLNLRSTAVVDASPLQTLDSLLMVDLTNTGVNASEVLADFKNIGDLPAGDLKSVASELGLEVVVNMP